MDTFVRKGELSEGQRNWHVIDAENQVVGRLASEIAYKLRGKHKPTFAVDRDEGDFVIVVNAEKIKFTGNKLNDKKYIHHTGFIGGVKEKTAKEVLEGKFPERVIEHAVKGMLPKNSLGRKQLAKLKVYVGAEHPHQSQVGRKA